jgi:hypothetical protein
MKLRCGRFVTKVSDAQRIPKSVGVVQRHRLSFVTLYACLLEERIVVECIVDKRRWSGSKVQFRPKTRSYLCGDADGIP